MSRTKIHTLQFGSVVDLADFASNTPRINDIGDPSSSDDDRDYDWDRGVKFKQALEMGRQGGDWAEGADMMRTSLELTADLAQHMPMPALRLSVEGTAPCIPAYLMNQPQTMFKRDKAMGLDKPVISIGVSTGISCQVEAAQRVRMGAAILTAVDQLEEQGYRCELVCLWRAPPINGSDPLKDWVNIETTIKRPEDRWNPVACAYMIAHPAAQRRLTWRVAETQEQWRKGMGYYFMHTPSEQFDKSMAADFDIFFPNMVAKQCMACNTEQGAFDWIQREFQTQLERMKQ